MANLYKNIAALNRVQINDNPITLTLIDPNTLSEIDRETFNNREIGICSLKPFKVTIPTRFNDVETSEPYSENWDYDSQEIKEIPGFYRVAITLKIEVDRGSYIWLYNINEKSGSDGELWYDVAYDNTIVISTNKVCLNTDSVVIDSSARVIKCPFNVNLDDITYGAGIMNITYPSKGVFDKDFVVPTFISIFPMNLNAMKKIVRRYQSIYIKYITSEDDITINSTSYIALKGEDIFTADQL